MIKTHSGELKIKGNLAELIADTCVLVKGLSDMYREEGIPDKLIIELINRVYEAKEKSDIELYNSVEKILDEINRKAQNSIL